MSPLPLFLVPPLSKLPSVPKIFLPNAHATERLGHLLGQTAKSGDILFLRGTLGAGKTSFSRGFVRAARKDPTIEVTSPTFLLCNTYPPNTREDPVPTIAHMDLWRIDDASKRHIVDYEKLFQQVALVEWPERLGWTPETRLELLLEYPNISKPSGKDPLNFEDDDDMDDLSDGRFASFNPFGADWQERVDLLLNQCPVADDKMSLVLPNYEV